MIPKKTKCDQIIFFVKIEKHKNWYYDTLFYFVKIRHEDLRSTDFFLTKSENQLKKQQKKTAQMENQWFFFSQDVYWISITQFSFYGSFASIMIRCIIINF